jgi:hypothetical protein
MSEFFCGKFAKKYIKTLQKYIKTLHNYIKNITDYGNEPIMYPVLRYHYQP